MALTDTKVRTLKPAGGKAECLVADGNGLYLRVRGDARTWQFRRKDGGKLTVTTLGTYPALSLRDARLRAAELATRRQAYSPTVAEAAELWTKERVDVTHRQAEQVRGYIDRAILPALGKMRVRDVEPSDVAKMVRDYRDKVATFKRARVDGRPAARALLAVAKGLFNYCVASGMVERSPAAQLGAALIGAPQAARSRVLTDDELKAVMTTTATVGPVLRFLLATGLRIGEVYRGHRDGQYWVVPAAASKNKVEHRVWLSAVALAALEGHPWQALQSTVQHWLKVNGGGFTAHDIRRTFATRNNNHGVPPHIVEKMLNHSLGGMMAVYNHAPYDGERRSALEAWSTWLLDLVEARPAAVVPLREGRVAHG